MSERCPACGHAVTLVTLAAGARRDRMRFLMRAGRGRTQAELARALGVTQATVSRDLRELGAVRAASAAWTLPSPEPAGARP